MITVILKPTRSKISGSGLLYFFRSSSSPGRFEAGKTTLETPKKQTTKPSRLGPVSGATPHQRRTLGGADFDNFRRRRQARHAAYLATQPTPTLFVGGFNPFEQKDVGAAIRKVRQLVAERFGQFCDVSSQNTPDVKFHKKLNTSMKLVFRPEDDDEDVRILENSEGSSGGHGVGHHQNSTIVID
ncbi:Protein CBG21180 [Caenorhabditis briggsae]|uniref:Protein CBG21180 n=1 Tax=Caenorhabditis briggsae TaxID=6238 RepID=A8XZP0_CAEBR|nr:Protein CBG21180 [Caenorhabditis briggsae]CAP38039.2 Protein CBG21180 [Caenorhabditis briggsae]